MDYTVGDVVLFDNIDSIYGVVIANYQILKYGRSDCTHVGIIGEVTKDNVVIYEARAKGFYPQTYGRTTLDYRRGQQLILIRSPKIKLTNVKKYCEKYLGRDYSWFDVFRIGITFILGVHLSFGCAKHLICSEAVARILYDASNKKLNLSKEFGKPYDLITPQDVSNHFRLDG